MPTSTSQLPPLAGSVSTGLQASLVAFLLEIIHRVWRPWGRLPVVTLILWLALLYFMRRRHNWARLLYVVGAAGYVYFSIAVVRPFLHNDRLESAIVLSSALLAAFGAARLLQRSSSEWFQQGQSP